MNTVNADRRYFPRGPGLGLRTLVLSACAIGLIFADRQGVTLKPLRDAATLAISPLLWVAALPHNAVTSASGVKTRETLERENRELQEKQLLLQARLEKFEALEAENHRIRELLASAKNLTDRVLITEIIAVSQDPYRHQITLNKGSRDEVYRGQALIDAYGVLGQVVEVGPTTSQALLLTDPDHGIPVEVNRTGLQTIALGRGDGSGLRLPFLASNADVQVGDLLVSSALGGRFPSGYPVGKVYEVKHTAGENFMEASAFPTAKLNQGRQALLVWSQRSGSDSVAPAPATSDAPAAEAPAATTATPAGRPPAAAAAGASPESAPTPAATNEIRTKPAAPTPVPATPKPPAAVEAPRPAADAAPKPVKP